jgi:hypothetical protein
MSAAIAANSAAPVSLAPLNLTVSSPPNQWQVQQIADPSAILGRCRFVWGLVSWRAGSAIH